MRLPASLRHELRLFFVALQFLTRVPVPAWVGYEPGWLNQAPRYFALVGAAVGAFGAVLALAALWLWPPAIAAVLVVTGTVWLTVAFHEDGLADTFDALLGVMAREKALSIMKDSRIGTYGAAALVLGLLLRVSLLAELLTRAPLLGAAALVAAHAAGRASAVALMAVLPYGGDEVHARAKPLARSVRRPDAAWAALTGAAAGALAAAFAASPAQAFVASVLAIVLLVAGLRVWLRRRLGGYTGDTLGAAEQFGEIAVLLAFVAAGA